MERHPTFMDQKSQYCYGGNTPLFDPHVNKIPINILAVFFVRLTSWL